MRQNKPGLADLKKLRQQAQPAEPAPPPTRTRRAAPKRAPFLPPSSTPSAAPPPSDSGSPAPETTGLSPADRNLFRHAVRHVEKIKNPNRVLLAPTAVAHTSILEERRLRAAGQDTPAPKKRAGAPGDTPGQPREVRKPRPLSDSYASASHDQDDSRYLKPGHGTDVLRDLKRGKWPIGASLDLHGSTLDDARERFDRFLSSCLTHDIKCVRIVHGKGHGSPNGDAVLKTTVRRWLTQIVEVIAYVECAEADGGSGAVQVLLK